MNHIRKSVLVALSLICVIASAAAAEAQQVTAKISTREAYVGMPVVLQVQVKILLLLIHLIFFD